MRPVNHTLSSSCNTEAAFVTPFDLIDSELNSTSSPLLIDLGNKSSYNDNGTIVSNSDITP